MLVDSLSCDSLDFAKMIDNKQAILGHVEFAVRHRPFWISLSLVQRVAEIVQFWRATADLPSTRVEMVADSSGVDAGNFVVLSPGFLLFFFSALPKLI